MMTWTRKELKTRAKAAVKMYYWKMVLVGFILAIISGGTGSVGSRFSSSNSSDSNQSAYNMIFGSGMDTTIIKAVILAFIVLFFISLLLRIFVFDLLVAGCRGFFNHSFEGEPSLSDIVCVFQENYWNGVKVCFLRNLYVALWSLLFVIPGIVKSYEYRMVPYLLAENPHMSSQEIFAKSREMMTGNKWDTFVLDLSFIGWMILSGLTLGILHVFWVAPYIYATDAALYRKLSGADYTQDAGAGTYENTANWGYTGQDMYHSNTTQDSWQTTMNNASSAAGDRPAEGVYNQNYFSDEDEK